MKKTKQELIIEASKEWGTINVTIEDVLSRLFDLIENEKDSLLKDEMKPSNTNLAKFYGLTRQTIGTYKKDKPKIYEALKMYFMQEHKLKKT